MEHYIKFMKLLKRLEEQRWKRALNTFLAIILVASYVPFAGAPQQAKAASASPELIVDYEFTDQGSGNILPADKKGNSTLTEVSGTHGGKTYGNTTETYGTDSTGPYWQWTTNANRGGGFTLDIDPAKVAGKDIEKSYTMSVRFSYDSFASDWTKIIDYKNKTADTGFYFNNSNKLYFYQIGNVGATSASPNSIIDIIATRDETTKKFTAYMIVNGVFQKEIEVDDTGGQAIPTLVDGKIRFGFFHDDYASAGAEKTTGGKVYSIKFWDGAVTPANVLDVTAKKGTAESTTDLTLPAPQTSGNTFKVVTTDKLLTFPMPGEGVPAGAIDYSSGDLAGVDQIANKYVGIYEVDTTGQIVGFRLLTLTANEIKQPLVNGPNPGGISGAVLWLRPDKGISVESGKLVSEWQDQSGQNNHGIQVNNTLQPTYQNDDSHNINFNPVLNFKNKILNLDVTKLPTAKNNRTIVAVAETSVNSGNHYIISWGTNSALQLMGMMQIGTTGALTGYTNEFQSSAGFWEIGVPNELFGTFDGTNNQGALYSKMNQIGNAPRSWNTGTNGAAVGSILGGGQYWDGKIGDLIVYDRVLDSIERQQLSSYLSIKYGYTLAGVNYLNSSANVLWDETTNVVYHHNIAGIARDDNGGLLQKQSNSTNSGHQVIIGLDGITDKNSTNSAEFLTDKQYLIWGDNNQPFTYTKPIGDRAHTERIWKVQNVGNIGEVEFAIPKDALPEKGALLVGNEDFSSATEHFLTLKTINGKEYYTAKLTFTDGQYFTLVTTKPELEAATLTQTVTDENKVTLIFDQSVTLTDLNGFTITKDGKEIPIQSVTHTIDGNKIILTLPTNENVTNESVIKVKYEKDSGNLKGSTNNLPVGNFEIDAVNSFATSLKINEPSTTIVAKPKPDIKGEVEAGSNVEVVIKDKLGNVVPNAGGMASVDGNGNWTYTPSLDLATGDYTIEVKATKNDKTVTKTKPLTIVDKTALHNKVTEIEGLTPTHYTSESWSKLQEKLTEAKAVLTNPSATQQEVNAALQALEDAQNALKAPKPTSVALTQTVTDSNKVTLTFNQEVELTDLTGFTVMVDGTPVTPTFEVDPTDNKKVIFTLPNGTDVTNKEVKVVYNGAGNLKGKGATGAPVENFEMVAEDPYSAAFQITKPDAVTANPQPTIGGKVDVTTTPSTVTIVLKNDKDEPLHVDVAATVDPLTGEWTFTPPTDLPDGTYTIIATATNGQQTVTKKHTFTVATTPIVNKVPLQQKVEEAKNLVAGEYTPASWAQYQEALKKANEVLTNPNATQEEVDKALAALTAAQNALVKIGKGLGTLTPSTGTLSPSFQTGVTDYTMTVGYPTNVIDFTAIPVEAGATVTTTVNGQPGSIGQIPLRVGENILVITVKDANGNEKHYTVKIYRQADTSYPGGGNSGNSGTTTPVTPTPGDTKTKIQVELEIDGEKPLEKTTVEIERTKHANGDITDFVALTEANAKEAVAKAKAIGNDIARIVLPDVNDEVKEAKVEIPKESLKLLRDNGLALEISSENGHIAIPVSSMEGIDDNFYFRLVPVKKESERQAIEERARAERVVRATLQSNDVHVVARPMTIETNMPSRPVQVTLPLKGVKIPIDSKEREAFLKQLAVFIEHSDGEKKVVITEVVTMAKGELGLRFTVEKFSTFMIIQVNKEEETKPSLEVKEHEAYIKGFPDGTFGPEKNVTRAQVATMIARILGYTDGPVNTAPFKDIPSDHYAAGAIAFVKERGIMNGDVHGNFRASENITRAQMATVVANFKQLHIEENVAITFNDTKGHWAQWIIEANRAAGIINGRQDGSFAPDEHLTRAQAVVMMNRMFERGPLQGVTAPSFPDVKATHWAFKEIEEAAKSHTYFIDEDGDEQLTK